LNSSLPTDDLDAFLAALTRAPKDAAAHAALADWLQENPGRIVDFVRRMAPYMFLTRLHDWSWEWPLATPEPVVPAPPVVMENWLNLLHSPTPLSMPGWVFTNTCWTDGNAGL
jgi:uncharacterized protein (TIGR02996 family)